MKILGQSPKWSRPMVRRSVIMVAFLVPLTSSFLVSGVFHILKMMITVLALLMVVIPFLLIHRSRNGTGPFNRGRCCRTR